MNMQNDYRFVTPEDIASFGGLEARKKAWSKTGWIGSYLRELGVAAWVQDVQGELGTVFFHGGANNHWASTSIDGMNQKAKDLLKFQTNVANPGLFGVDGPLWYRGYALGPEHEICRILDEALNYMNASRMVIGHTPQMDGKILSRCQHKVFVIDVGISRVYGGHSAALEILDRSVTALYPGKRIKLI